MNVIESTALGLECLFLGEPATGPSAGAASGADFQQELTNALAATPTGEASAGPDVALVATVAASAGATAATATLPAPSPADVATGPVVVPGAGRPGADGVRQVAATGMGAFLVRRTATDPGQDAATPVDRAVVPRDPRPHPFLPNDRRLRLGAPAARDLQAYIRLAARLDALPADPAAAVDGSAPAGADPAGETASVEGATVVIPAAVIPGAEIRVAGAPIADEAAEAGATPTTAAMAAVAPPVATTEAPAQPTEGDVAVDSGAPAPALGMDGRHGGIVVRDHHRGGPAAPSAEPGVGVPRQDLRDHRPPRPTTDPECELPDLPIAARSSAGRIGDVVPRGLPEGPPEVASDDPPVPAGEPTTDPARVAAPTMAPHAAAGDTAATPHTAARPTDLGMINVERVVLARQHLATRPVQRLAIDLDDARVALRVRDGHVAVDVLRDPSGVLGDGWSASVERTLDRAARAVSTQPGQQASDQRGEHGAAQQRGQQRHAADQDETATSRRRNAFRIDLEQEVTS